jgi:hypothetical protein
MTEKNKFVSMSYDENGDTIIIQRKLINHEV